MTLQELEKLAKAAAPSCERIRRGHGCVVQGWHPDKYCPPCTARYCLPNALPPERVLALCAAAAAWEAQPCRCKENPQMDIGGHITEDWIECDRCEQVAALRAAGLTSESTAPEGVPR